MWMAGFGLGFFLAHVEEKEAVLAAAIPSGQKGNETEVS